MQKMQVTAVSLRGYGTFSCTDVTNLPLVVLLVEPFGRGVERSPDVEAWDFTSVEVRSDVRITQNVWLRKVLLSAITTVCHGRANGIAVFERVHEALSMTTRTGLSSRWGGTGSVHIIPDEDKATKP